MNVEAQLRLSYYTEIANINEKHNVKLVQHTETGKIFVLKKLEVYSLSVYEFLSKNTFNGVAKIEEIIESENCLYIIEEYISGYTLREIIDKKGSAPRGKGAKMIVFKTGETVGTIGGGQGEFLAVKKAMELLKKSDCFLIEKYNMDNKTAASEGMICGGEITVLFEKM